MPTRFTYLFLLIISLVFAPLKGHSHVQIGNNNFQITVGTQEFSNNLQRHKGSLPLPIQHKPKKLLKALSAVSSAGLLPNVYYNKLFYFDQVLIAVVYNVHINSFACNDFQLRGPPATLPVSL